MIPVIVAQGRVDVLVALSLQPGVQIIIEGRVHRQERQQLPMLGHGELQGEVPGTLGIIGAHPVHHDGLLATVIVPLGDPLEDGSGLEGRLITLVIILLIRWLGTPGLI